MPNTTRLINLLQLTHAQFGSQFKLAYRRLGRFPGVIAAHSPSPGNSQFGQGQGNGNGKNGNGGGGGG